MQIISSTGKHNMDAHSEHKAQKETDSAHTPRLYHDDQHQL